MPELPPSADRTRTGAGIALALGAFALFTAMDTVVKLLAARWPAVQIAFFNALFAMVPTGALIARRGIGSLATRRPHLHALRGACSIVGVSLAFYAFGRLPIADAYAVLFAMPLIITALSAPLLREPVGWRRGCAVIVGFLGILIMLRPGSGLLDVGAAAALLAAFAQSLTVLLVRRMHTTETSVAFATYGNVAVMLGTGAALPFVFVVPTTGEILLSAGAGMVAGTAFQLLIEAYRRAPAAIVAPFQYSQMPYGLVVGWAIFGTSPEPVMLAGAALVVASGLYVLHREAALGRRTAAAPAGPSLRRRWRRPAT